MTVYIGWFLFVLVEQKLESAVDYSDITEVADEFETKYRDAMSSMQAPRTGRPITKLTFEHCS